MADEVGADDELEELDLDLDLDDMDTGDLEILIEEYERQGLGPRWLEEIRTAASRVVRRYSPLVYARSAVWNEEAIDDPRCLT